MPMSIAEFPGLKSDIAGLYKALRRSQVIFSTVTITTTATRVVQLNSDRIALMLSASNGALDYGFSNAVTSGTGIRMSAGNPPLLFSLWQHGLLAAQEFWGIVAAGTAGVVVAEVLLRPEDWP